MDALIKKEGWRLITENGEEFIIAEGQKFPKAHPLAIHLRLYRDATNPETKYMHMRAAHDYLWPTTVWHYWTERRFREHCNGWNYITFAGGASTSKSYDAAKIAILFWLGDPGHRAVVVASTSLESLNTRIWGYVTKLINESAFKNFHYFRSNPPKILYSKKDTIHGMFAVAAKKGDDDAAISGWIGRHPSNGLMMILDEATDMPHALMKAFPNLESGQETFQCIAIGNSLSKYDLHGAMSTPKLGWKTVDPMRDNKWETNQKNGICLFFSCYESPAIFETDPERKKRLGRFLITKELIDEKKKQLGAETDSFYRFVLGFWRTDAADDAVISKAFMEEYNVFVKSEWSGLYPLHMVAGLDPAFSVGGDSCILRLAVIGQNTRGQVVLDFRGEDLLFKIPISAVSDDSIELQIADRVIEIMKRYNVRIQDLYIDANGQGRALGEVIKLRAGSLVPPFKIYSARQGSNQVNSFDVIVMTPYELYFAFRDYIQNGQIKGVDFVTANQITSRLVVIKNGKPKLETKAEFKNRMGTIMPSLAHSPDEADAATLALQSAIRNYGFSPGQARDLQRIEGFAHEKMFAFLELQKQDIAESQVRRGPPVAKFDSGLESLIQHKGRFVN